MIDSQEKTYSSKLKNLLTESAKREANELSKLDNHSKTLRKQHEDRMTQLS